MHYKYSIVKRLYESPLLDDTTKVALQAYLKQGVSYSPATASIATENRQ